MIDWTLLLIEGSPEKNQSSASGFLGLNYVILSHLGYVSTGNFIQSRWSWLLPSKPCLKGNYTKDRQIKIKIVWLEVHPRLAHVYTPNLLDKYQSIRQWYQHM